MKHRECITCGKRAYPRRKYCSIDCVPKHLKEIEKAKHEDPETIVEAVPISKKVAEKIKAANIKPVIPEPPPPAPVIPIKKITHPNYVKRKLDS